MNLEGAMMHLRVGSGRVADTTGSWELEAGSWELDSGS